MTHADYNATIAAAKANGHEIKYNVPVEGTAFQLTCWVPAFDIAYVSGPVFNRKQSDYKMLQEKMREIKKRTRIGNLMVFISE